MRKIAAIPLTGVLLCLGLGMTAGPAGAETPLIPYSAEYDVKISIAGGQLDTQLVSNDGGYVATHVVRPTGWTRLFTHGEISEISMFHIMPDGLRPDRYRSEDTLSRDKGTVSIRFDWEEGTATGRVNDEAVVSTMDGIAFDRISIQYELMYDLLNGRPSDKYVLFDVDELKPLTVRNIGHRSIEVPAGTFDAIGMQHETENSKRTTTLWCAKELGYLPVMIEQFHKGKLSGRAELSKYTANP
jgi:Protein of unknown function (DUF3108)